MKNLLIGLLFLGFTNLSFAQVTQAIHLEDVIISPLNLSYLNEVQDENTPERAKALEDKAARFDITESDVFDNKSEAYEVIFSEDRDRIVATYDENGKIMSSFEKFKDVALPSSVRQAIAAKYPGWSVHSDTYLVRYYHGKDVKKVFKVKIKKDNATKNLKVDIDGNVK